MKDLKSLADAKVGQRLSFAYYGGETPGRTRQVDVTEVLDDRIVGTDVEKRETRQYMFDKAAVVVVVHEPVAMVAALEADLDENQPIAAEAACDVTVEPIPTTRVRRTPLSFPAARDLLHQQIDALNGDDLAEVLGEIQGDDRAKFDAANGQVVLERDVVLPHCVVNDNAHTGAAGIDWVNEDGERITTTFLHDGDTVRLHSGSTEVSAESLVTEIAQHLGLTIS